MGVSWVGCLAIEGVANALVIKAIGIILIVSGKSVCGPFFHLNLTIINP